jgi:hypothetical protein
MVPNGGCAATHAVTVDGVSRIEVAASSTAQNPTDLMAEILGPDGKVVAGGSRAAYDTPGGGSYGVRVCSSYEEQNPPNQQYSALIGTGPAGQPVLDNPPQPQPPTGGVLGTTTFLGFHVRGKVAVVTGRGLAWFTLGTSNAKTTLRFVDPTHHNKLHIVRGLTATVMANNTVRITGHAVRLVLAHGRASFVSSSLGVSGRIARGHYQIEV